MAGGAAGMSAAGAAPGGRNGSGGTAGGPAGGGAGSGSGGTGGMVGGTGTPKPSTGCGKSGRPASGQVQVANQSLYVFPDGYDGTKPYPLLIAIHACGNPNTEFVSLTDKTTFATDYVRSFPNTPDSGQCWSNYTGDVARITMQYDELMSTYCIDENRVFAIAHSSGAQLLVNILSHKSDADHLNLKGISPVAADPYNVAVPMPVLYIDGKNDNQRSADSAKNTVAKFRMSNSCADTSMPYTAVKSCNSTDSGHPLVDPGCIIYDSCAVPTIWCSHNDPSYSGTEHGVPCFAIQSMIDFFGGL
jgi:poly(3-hydroxybutyrate) depolymerase